MDAAFVLVVNKRGGAPTPRSGPGRLDLGFGAQGQRRWTDAGGAVHLSIWQRSPVGSNDPQSWHETDGAITFVAGELLFAGAAADPAGWAASVAGLSATRSFSEVQRELRGIFASVHLDDRGNGWVLSDPHGLRCLYTAEDADAVIVSSRAALVARAMSEPPARDVVNACWLSYTGYHVGPSTGYRGVRVVAPGSVLTLHGGRASWVHRPALTEPVGESEPVAALADRVMVDVAGSLRSVLDQDGPTPVIRLTGGKDSRLILAAALHAGIAHEFRYETIGYPGLADADVASELASRLGLRHDLRFIGMRSDEPYDDRVRRFVEATGCLNNAWTIDSPTGAAYLSVTGIGGETLRAFFKVPEGTDPGRVAAKAMGPKRVNRLELVHSEVATQLADELSDRLAMEPTPSSSVFTRQQAHYLGHRLRFPRVGPREEIGGDRRIQPLYSHVTIDAAMALPPRDRQSEILFAEAMRQASPVLVEHRFAGPAWDARARAHLGIATPAAQPPIGPKPPPAVAQREPPSLMAAVQAEPGDERVGLLTSVFANADNPAWEALDRQAAVGALARYASLNNPERMELFGAATAAIWLGR